MMSYSAPDIVQYKVFNTTNKESKTMSMFLSKLHNGVSTGQYPYRIRISIQDEMQRPFDRI